MSELENIIARLEKATGPDRALDEEIAVAITPTISTSDDLVYATLRDRRGGDATHPGHYFIKSRSGASARTAPFYTASIDAALTLVPEDHLWLVHGWPADIGLGETYGAMVAVRLPRAVDLFHTKPGRTAAIALCIASLRARAALTNTEGA